MSGNVEVVVELGLEDALKPFSILVMTLSSWVLCSVVPFDKCCMQAISSGIIVVPFTLRIEVLACFFFEFL